MNKNLNSYVKKYKNFLDKKFCNGTINQIEKSDWRPHTFYDFSVDKNIDRSGELELDVSNNCVTNGNIIMKKIWFSLRDYYSELNFPWFNTWHGFSNIRFNRYENNKKMAEHCDHIHSMFEGERKGVPILSVLGILNDNYKGGEFIMFKDTEIKLKQGDLLIFPSNFLYPHRVEPVTKGTRYSYISWVW